MSESIFNKWLGKRITNEFSDSEDDDFDKKLKNIDSSINQDSKEPISKKVKEPIGQRPNTTRLNDFDNKLKRLDSLIKDGTRSSDSGNGIKGKIEYSANIKKFNSINKLKYALNKYDDLNKDRKDFMSYTDSLNNEVHTKDVNTSIDNELNNILLEKLNVNNNKKEKPLSEKQKKELQRQIEADKNRENEFRDKTEKLKSVIDDFDDKKKKENEEYITYKDRIIHNEKEEEDLDDETKAKKRAFDSRLDKEVLNFK